MATKWPVLYRYVYERTAKSVVIAAQLARPDRPVSLPASNWELINPENFVVHPSSQLHTYVEPQTPPKLFTSPSSRLMSCLACRTGFKDWSYTAVSRHSGVLLGLSCQAIIRLWQALNNDSQQTWGTCLVQNTRLWRSDTCKSVLLCFWESFHLQHIERDLMEGYSWEGRVRIGIFICIPRTIAKVQYKKTYMYNWTLYTMHAYKLVAAKTHPWPCHLYIQSLPTLWLSCKH